MSTHMSSCQAVLVAALDYCLQTAPQLLATLNLSLALAFRTRVGQQIHERQHSCQHASHFAYSLDNNTQDMKPKVLPTSPSLKAIS